MENGEIHDQYRIKYLKAHILEMKKAMVLDGFRLWGIRLGDALIW